LSRTHATMRQEIREGSKGRREKEKLRRMREKNEQEKQPSTGTGLARPAAGPVIEQKKVLNPLKAKKGFGGLQVRKLYSLCTKEYCSTRDGSARHPPSKTSRMKTSPRGGRKEKSRSPRGP